MNLFDELDFSEYNEQGWRFAFHKLGTEWAEKYELPHKVFVAERQDGYMEYVLIDETNSVVFSSQRLEDIAVHIDIVNLVKTGE